jgi:hypothetical protein
MTPPQHTITTCQATGSIIHHQPSLWQLLGLLLPCLLPLLQSHMSAWPVDHWGLCKPLVTCSFNTNSPLPARTLAWPQARQEAHRTTAKRRDNEATATAPNPYNQKRYTKPQKPLPVP